MINPALYSSASPEHYTPHHIIEAAIKCMGGIHLDPCSNSKTNPNVPAVTVYTKEDDGLSKPWNGNVWLNPPFSVPKVDKNGKPVISPKTGKRIMSPVIHLWIEKLVFTHLVNKSIPMAIALVPARTDTEWFKVLNNFPVCFVYGRLKFSDAKNSAPFPTALIALGISSNKFAQHFEHIGRIYSPVTPF